METAATEHRTCTCHPSEAPRVCQRKFALRDCLLEEGRKLFKAMHVQQGKVEYHYETDAIGVWDDQARVTLPDGSHQLLLSDQDAEVTEFFAWVVKHFNTLTER